MNIKSVFAATGWALTLLINGFAQTDLPFTSGSTGADGPLVVPRPISARSAQASAYDSVRQRVVLFGGFGTPELAETWEWDGEQWTQRFPSASPPVRALHAMTYDSVRQRVVLFGGVTFTGGVNYADTWEWDGTNWTQRFPAVSPSGRYQHALAYDSARQRVVLFAGWNGIAHSSDTWEWDGTNWARKFPTTSPSARSDNGLAYDAARGRVVLFGGSDGPIFSDTWEWDGINWVRKTPASAPQARVYLRLAYDSVRQRVVLFGGVNVVSNGVPYADTWEWNGTTWAQRFSTTSPPARYYHSLEYDSARQRVVLFGGQNTTTSFGDTWVWDGTNWNIKSSAYLFDMTGRATGIWNFTSVTIPQDATVTFKKNAGNTPIVWFATENVRIDGVVDISGGDAIGNNLPDGVGKGGPGGFDGGVGGTRFDVTNTFVGQPGQGPGGGPSGTTTGQAGGAATYKTTYGNAYIQPLIGGSGGGGGASTTNQNGTAGGGGGGAILIASSRDIVMNGSIKSQGGLGTTVAPRNNGGTGSGGAVRLIADRVLGTGTINASDSGRIRLEGFNRELAGTSHSVIPSAAAPIGTFLAAASGQLIVANVAGQPVSQPPTGSLLSPDVVFTKAGQITVTLAATSIPNGTPVTLRITTSGGTINLPAQGAPAVTLSNGTATFTATVPAGLGTIQAAAQYTVP